MKIVILDDSVTIRMILESYLEDIGVNEDEMFFFETGPSALEFISYNGADIVFTDINMPVMNGYEFAAEVFKIRPDLKNLFFAISGDENRSSYQKMKDIGVHRFIKKPIDVEYFQHFIEPEVIKFHAKKK
ncbi:response regulator [Sulfurimonas sp.]|nr:response regulator [Sulfurimonas sp.]